MNTRLKSISGSDWMWRIRQGSLIIYNCRTHDMLMLPWPEGMEVVDVARWRVHPGGRSCATNTNG